MDGIKEEFIDFYKNIAPKILMFIIVLVIGIVLARIFLSLVKKFLLKSKLEHTIKTFFMSIIRVFTYLIVFLISFRCVGIEVSTIITTIGAAAVTAGLALQDTLKNLVSGIIILFTKPFVAGDLIEFEGYTGFVDSIRIFFTSIHTYDNRTVKIPNSKLTSDNVVNCTYGDNRRVNLKYTISYDDNIAKAKSVILDVISKNKDILTDPEPGVHVGEHLDSGIEILVYVWVESHKYYSVYYYMQETVKNAFDENSITIPYPHVVVKKD